MSQIRPFRNADLPRLVDLWVRHASAYTAAPEISVAMFEQAVLARNFFNPATLLVAEYDGYIHAWCHWVDLPDAEEVILAAVCYSPEGGAAIAAPLLEQAESRIHAAGSRRIVAGPLRDRDCGYAGLAPIGHGAGVPEADSRLTSLLRNAGYDDRHAVERLRVSTAPYRLPVSREGLQLGRTTRIQSELVIPDDPRRASAMSHLDIERHILVDHRSGATLAAIELWTSDPEVQVMMPSDAILDFAPVAADGELDPPHLFLIGSLLRTLANRRIFHVETAIDRDQEGRIESLRKLHFQLAEPGIRMEKSLDATSP